MLMEMTNHCNVGDFTYLDHFLWRLEFFTSKIVCPYTGDYRTCTLYVWCKSKTHHFTVQGQEPNIYHRSDSMDKSKQSVTSKSLLIIIMACGVSLSGCLSDNSSKVAIPISEVPTNRTPGTDTPDTDGQKVDCSANVSTSKTGFGNSEASYSAWIEAEDVTHNLLLRTEADEGFEEATTSGDMLRMEKNSELFVEWPILNVLEDGLTEIIIRGASPWGSTNQTLTIFDVAGNEIYKDNAFDMHNSGDGPKKWAEYKVYAKLPAGQYSLEIGDDMGYVFFDALRVRDQTVVRDSEINLNHVNYYKSLNNKIEFNLSYNFNKLMRFEINGRSLDYNFGENCEQVYLRSEALSELSQGEYDLKIIFNQGADAITKLVVHTDIILPAKSKYEAERQSTGTGVERITDKSANAGAYVLSNNFGVIEFVVVAPESGKYEVKARYQATNSDAKRKLHINGKRMRTAIGFRYTADWDTSPSWILPLEEGVNTITLTPDFGLLSLDYLQISEAPVVMLAQVHPIRNTVYLGDNLKPVKIKIDPYNQKLVSIGTAKDSIVNFTTEDHVISIEGEDIAMLEGGFFTIISTTEIEKLGVGRHQLSLDFDDETNQVFELEVRAEDNPKVAALTLTFFDVSHGLAVLMQMPDGTNIMADTAKYDVNEQRVRPFLIANKIPLDEIWTSHRHGDHYGGKSKLLEAYGDIIGAKLKDNQSLEVWDDDGCTPMGELPFARNDEISYGDAHITILNAHGDQCNNGYLDFNPNSLAFRLDYNGFRFAFQGDIYAQQQDENLAVHGEEAIKVDVLQSNHHWHGSISSEYVKKTGADLIIISASEHIWGAGSFTQDGMAGVNYLKDNNPDFKERLMTFDAGHVVVKVFEDGTWSYETINSNSLEYVEDETIPNVMNYSQYDLDAIKVDNFKGYRQETRDFPIKLVKDSQVTFDSSFD
ncbi:MAG: beta-lactamase superfamily II metal-dependent hydrolase [Paraglaciecola sp.]|jgi:beta-lactamase superfamily II metal-dependent hydrolase